MADVKPSASIDIVGRDGSGHERVLSDSTSAVIRDKKCNLYWVSVCFLPMTFLNLLALVAALPLAKASFDSNIVYRAPFVSAHDSVRVYGTTWDHLDSIDSSSR
jgi:hypothetical protein